MIGVDQRKRVISPSRSRRRAAKKSARAPSANTRVRRAFDRRSQNHQTAAM